MRTLRIVTYCVIDFKDNECSSIGHIIIPTSASVMDKVRNVIKNDEDPKMVGEMLAYIINPDAIGGVNTFYGNDCKYEISVEDHFIF